MGGLPKLAAARALGIFWLVTDHCARKLRWQGCAFRLLAWFGRRSRRINRFQFGLDGRDIGIKQVVEQAALIRAQLLAALGKFVPFEQCDFVAELFDDGLITVDFFAHRGDLLPERVDLRQQLHSECTQLLRRHLIDIWRRNHAVDFTKAGLLSQ